MSGNLGTSRLRGGSGGGMRAFDSLPPPLRRWIAGAVLPWSSASCRRIWARGVARGESPAAILARLDRAEAQCLRRAGLSAPAGGVLRQTR